MKDLFDPDLVEQTWQRIQQLHAESERRWGKMAVAETLAHCTSGIEMALGILETKPAPFPARMVGRLIKPLVLRNDAPMRRNSPSSPELFARGGDKCEFLSERSRLLAAIDRFAKEGPVACARSSHPFFGPLTPQQWAILMYKHVDHHLRQFGV